MLPVGARVGSYSIVRVLNRARFSVNHEARGDQSQRVLIKELFQQGLVEREENGTVRPADAEDRAPLRWWTRCFLDKVRALASTQHPQLPRVL